MKSKLLLYYAKHRFAAAVVGAIFLFVFSAGGLVVANGETLEPNDSHVISLYVDGDELSIPSRAKTVGDFLTNAKIEVGEFDSVEPDRSQVIDSDLFRVRITRARPYTIRDGQKEYVSLSAHTSARLIAESAGLDLKPADSVEFLPLTLEDITTLGRVVEIVRSKQITLTLYGAPQIIHTNSDTVGDLLTELGISPAPDDQLSPARETVLTESMQVFVNRNGIKVVTEEIIIDPPVEYVQDESLTMGSSVTRDPGTPGKKIVIYEIITENESEISRKELSSVVIEQPRTKIVARGRAAGQIGAEREQLMLLAGISPEEFAAVNYIIGQESGWCATKWQGQWGRCPDFYEELHSVYDNIGYGLCQSTPPHKMESYGEDWRTNAITQLKWCYSYMKKYGSAVAAADFKQCLGECFSTRTNKTEFKRTPWF